MNKVKLGEIADFQTGPFGTQFSASEYVSAGVPVINVRNIGYGNIIEQDLEFVSEETKKRLRAHILKTSDIVFGRKGSVDRHAYIDERYSGWVQGSDCIRIRCRENINPHYLSHYLKLAHVKKQINSSAVGSTMASLNVDILKDIMVILPDIFVQNQIESILSVLEEKIEINSQICVELEAMAKTLYDYWFVQFDFPDENGRPYRTSGGEMVWNAQLKREIPKGWNVGKLSDISNITMGQSPAGESYNDTGKGLVFYQGRTDFGLRFPTPRMYTTTPTRFAQKGDILLSVRAPVGDLNFAMENCCIGRGLAALSSKLGSQMHLFYTLSGFQRIFDVMNGNGTTFGSITKDILFDMAVVIPANETLLGFEERVKPIETKIEKCEEEIRELTKLRDWLLPMLMNGQARVE